MTDYTDLKRRGVKVFTLDGQYDDWGMIDPDTERFVLWDGDWVKAEDANAAIAALEAEVARLQGAKRVAFEFDGRGWTLRADLSDMPIALKAGDIWNLALADQPVTGSPR